MANAARKPAPVEQPLNPLPGYTTPILQDLASRGLAYPVSLGNRTVWALR